VKYAIAATVLLFASLAVSQEIKHAPTVEQCRADQRLWLGKVENDPSVASVGYKELKSWGNEMLYCESVDPDYYNRYYNTDAEIAFVKLGRLIDFLDRHNLRDQFDAEDAAGKR